jgi:hypothetical protein
MDPPVHQREGAKGVRSPRVPLLGPGARGAAIFDRNSFVPLVFLVVMLVLAADAESAPRPPPKER